MKERVIEWLKASSEESGAKEQEESLRWISSDSAIAQVQLRKIEFEANIQILKVSFMFSRARNDALAKIDKQFQPNYQILKSKTLLSGKHTT